MSDAVKYTITVGNNTSVTATKYEINDKQLKQLEALAQSGDISLDKTTGIITAKTSHGLVVAGAIVGVPIDEMMDVDGLPGEICRGMTHESTMAAINRFSSTNPDEMSLSELMTCMMMMVYQSESERREALQTAKGSQLLIQMDQARMAWSQSREAAEKEFSNALMTAIGTISSSVISAGMGIAGGIVQGVASYYNNASQAKAKTLQKAQLSKKVDGLQKKAENIALDNAKKIEANNKTIQNNDEKIKDKGNTNQDTILSEEMTKLESDNVKLKKENEALKEKNEKLGFDESGKALRNDKDIINYEGTELENDQTYQQIKELGGIIYSNGTITDNVSDVPWGKKKEGPNDGDTDINVGHLRQQNEELESKARSLSTLANGLQSASVIGQVFAGGFQIGAAYAQKDAAFLRAEAQLTDAFRNFSAAMVQNIDSSANQALQQMNQLVSSLKEVFRSAYEIECSIARNI